VGAHLALEVIVDVVLERHVLEITQVRVRLVAPTSRMPGWTGAKTR
jgi:hypothetical protein